MITESELDSLRYDAAMTDAFRERVAILQAECEAHRKSSFDMLEMAKAAEAENSKMRAVVDAAVAWESHRGVDNICALGSAVRSYVAARGAGR